MRFLDRAGVFKARAVEWMVRELPSGSPIIRVSFEVFEQLGDGEQFRPMASGSRIVHGDFFPVKQTGSPNEKVVEMLCCLMGWGGSFAEVHGCPPNQGPVQVEVEGRDYKGKTYYQVNWIRAEDAQAGGGGNIPPEKLSSLDDKYGKSLAAVAKKASAQKREQAPAAEPTTDFGDIPFMLLCSLAFLPFI
ncbi:MAG TPA: hypothetical protein VD965_07565 [Burkholderiales bacterium]|nr:hypothetical protein [Burkholderiales bacterium]